VLSVSADTSCACRITVRPQDMNIGRHRGTGFAVNRLRRNGAPQIEVCNLLTAVLQGQQALGRKLCMDLWGRSDIGQSGPQRSVSEGRVSAGLAASAVVGFLRTAVLEDSDLKFSTAFSADLGRRGLNRDASNEEQEAIAQAGLLCVPRLVPDSDCCTRVPASPDASSCIMALRLHMHALFQTGTYAHARSCPPGKDTAFSPVAVLWKHFNSGAFCLARWRPCIEPLIPLVVMPLTS
jgi:hypothetical protein